MCFGFGKWPLSRVDVTARLSIICSNRWWLYEREKKFNLLKIININLFKNLLHGGTSCASCFFSPHFLPSVIYYQTYTWQHEAFSLNVINDLGTTPSCKLWEKVKTVAVITRYSTHRSCRSLKRVGMFFFNMIFLQRKKYWLLWKESWNTSTSLCNQQRRQRG